MKYPELCGGKNKDFAMCLKKCSKYIGWLDK